MRLRTIVWTLVFVVFVLFAAMAEYVAAVKSSHPDTTSSPDTAATDNGSAGGDDTSSWMPAHDVP